MGQIFVKRNGTFEKIVEDRASTTILGQGGGGNGVVIAFTARRGTSSQNPHIQGIGNVGTPPYASGPNTISLCDSAWIEVSPSAYTETHNQAAPTDEASPMFEEARVRHISKDLLDNVGINKSSLSGVAPFSKETGFFTAPAKGIYQFDANACVHYLQSEGNRNQVLGMLWLQKANQSGNMGTPTTASALGTVLMRRATEQGSAFDDHDIVEMSGSWLVELEANDQIGLCARAEWGQNTAGTTTPTCRYISFSEVQFSGSYIGGVTVSPQDPVAFQCKTTGSLGLSVDTAYTVKAGTAPLVVEEMFDPSNCFNINDGSFTAPIAGVYSVVFNCNASTGGLPSNVGSHIWVQKHSAGTSVESATISRTLAYGNPLYQNNVGTVEAVTGSWLVQLQAGEKVTWHFDTIAGPGNNAVVTLSDITIGASLSTPINIVNPIVPGVMHAAYLGGFSTNPGTSTPPNIPEDDFWETSGQGPLWGIRLVDVSGSSYVSRGPLRVRNSNISQGSTLAVPVIQKIVDPSGSFSPETGIYVAPETGYYRIGFQANEWNFDGDTNDPTYYWIEKHLSSALLEDTYNGNLSNAYGNNPKRQVLRTGQIVGGPTAMWLVQLNRGDKITWHVRGAGAGFNGNVTYVREFVLTAEMISVPPHLYGSGYQFPEIVNGVTVGFHVHGSNNNYSPTCGIFSGVGDWASYTIPDAWQTASRGYKINFSKELNAEEVNFSNMPSGAGTNPTKPFETNDGLFTAPVAGLYEFSTQAIYQFFDNVGGGITLQHQGFLWIQKTMGTTLPIGSIDRSSCYGTFLSSFMREDPNAEDRNYESMSGSWIVWLNAGERVALCGAIFIGPHAGYPDNAFGNDFCPEVAFRQVSFSGKYVGGLPVQPSNPVAFECRMGGSPVGQAPAAGVVVPANTAAIRICNTGCDGYNGQGKTKVIIRQGGSGAETASVEYDPSNSFDPTTGAFTAPVTGVYSIGFDANTRLPENDGQVYYWIQKTSPGATLPTDTTCDKSNAVGSVVTQSSQAANYEAQSKEWIVSLNAGDRITWHLERRSGNYGVQVANWTWRASLNMVNQVIGVNTDVSFHVRSADTSTALTGQINGYISSPTFIVGTNTSYTQAAMVVSDSYPAGSFNSNTGVFTAPVTGMYEFDGQFDVQRVAAATSSVLFTYLWFEKNATNIASTAADPASPNRQGRIGRGGAADVGQEWAVARVLHHMQLNAGDTVALVAETGDGVGVPMSFAWSFSGKLLRRT